MHQLEGFQQFDSKGRELDWKLNSALYGIKQAPRVWNSFMTRELWIYSIKGWSRNICG